MSTPSALAVLRLITSSNLVDCSTGRSVGFVPRRILSDRKSTRLNSSHSQISYAVFCLKKKNSCSILPVFVKDRIIGNEFCGCSGENRFFHFVTTLSNNMTLVAEPTTYQH